MRELGSGKMAEQFLTLMGDLDEDTQNLMSAWYNILKNAGFTGIQTPGLSFHISLATFPLEQEQKAIELTEKAAGDFSRYKCISAISEYLLQERYCLAAPKETRNWIYFTTHVK